MAELPARRAAHSFRSGALRKGVLCVAREYVAIETNTQVFVSLAAHGDGGGGGGSWARAARSQRSHELHAARLAAAPAAEFSPRARWLVVDFRTVDRNE